MCRIKKIYVFICRKIFYYVFTCHLILNDIYIYKRNFLMREYMLEFLFKEKKEY